MTSATVERQPLPELNFVNFEIITSAKSPLPVLSFTSDAEFFPTAVEIDAEGDLCVTGRTGEQAQAVYRFEGPASRWSDLIAPKGFVFVRFDAFGAAHNPVAFELEPVSPSEAPAA